MKSLWLFCVSTSFLILGAVQAWKHWWSLPIMLLLLYSVSIWNKFQKVNSFSYFIRKDWKFFKIMCWVIHGPSNPLFFGGGSNFMPMQCYSSLDKLLMKFLSHQSQILRTIWQSKGLCHISSNSVVKFALERATKAKRWRRGIALLFFNLGTRWVWFNAMPSLSKARKDLVPIV